MRIRHKRLYNYNGFYFVESGSCDCKSYYKKVVGDKVAIIHHSYCDNGEQALRCPIEMIVKQNGNTLGKIEEPETMQAAREFLEQHEMIKKI